jgi:hypothetical protein
MHSGNSGEVVVVEAITADFKTFSLLAQMAKHLGKAIAKHYHFIISQLVNFSRN